MKFEIINPLDYSGWNDLLLTNEKSTFFHSSSWARVLSESYAYTPYYFTRINNGKLSVLISLMEVKSFLTGTKGVSLPFTDFCEPILPPEDSSEEVWETVLEFGKKAGWQYLEIRGGEGFGKTCKPSAWFYEHHLDLSDSEQTVYSRFRDSTKRNIKRAKKAGVEIVTNDSLESMRDFYRLNCMTRRMHGLPPQPFLFFKKIHANIIQKKQGLIVTARYRGKPVAAGIYCHFGTRAIYKYGASDAAYQHLRPNNLVMWRAIEWYCQHGLTSLNFGRTDQEHNGLRQFKAGWGTKEDKLNYFRYNFDKNSFVSTQSKVAGWHTAVFRKTPLPLLKTVGKFLYRHMG